MNIKKANNPYEISCKVNINTVKAVAQLEFASAIDNLMYVIYCTRPKITFTVCKLSRYISNPGIEYCKTIVRVLDYLKKTMNYGLFYNKFPVILVGYVDASK